MTIRSEQVEQEVLERVRPNYEREGYKFIVGPSPSDLPSFLEGVLPDALASRNGENVVIEVKSTLRSADRSALVKFLASEVRKHPGWRFDLVIAEKQLGVADSQYEPSESELVDELSKIEALTEGGSTKVALPLAWGLLEAVTRKLVLNEKLGESRRYLPVSVVEALVSDGFLDDDAGKRLIEIGRLRNLVVHGFARVSISKSDIQFLLKTVRALVEIVPNQPAIDESEG